jgi:uncharacterized delta-60 repeat protein
MKNRKFRFLAALLGAMLAVAVFVRLRAEAAASDPDPTLLSAGKVSLNLSANDNDYAESVVLQPDGKVVVGGTDNDFRIARYDASGNLDPAFGVNGVATIHFGAQDSLYDIAIQADGKIVAVGAGNINFADRYFAIARLNANGTLDTSFDGDGKLIYNAFGGNDYATCVAIQADQKIVVAGLYEPSSIDTAIIRLNANGTLDTSFDGDGVKIYSLSSGQDYANDVVIQPDQKILVGGIWDSVANHDFAVTRLNADGSFDTAFDGDGYAATAVNGDDVLQGLALQADGKIIGSGYSSGNQNFTVIRYNANGSLDTTFDGDGIAQTDFGGNRDDVGRTVAVQADGKIVVVGETNTVNGSRYDYGVVRYNTDGSLDASFDGDGKLTAQFNANNSIPTDIVVQSDGNFIVVGRSNWATVDFGAMRFNPNGTLDTTWGAGKINLDLFNNTDDEGRAVARQADGKLIVVGRYLNGPNFAIAVARYNANGTIDTTFGSSGKTTTQINSTYPQAVALQTDGKIVVAGYNYTGSGSDFLLVRYNTNGTLDTAFDGDGLAILNVTVNDRIYGMALQPDGKIVAVGALENATDDFVVLRYNTDGTLDTSFDGDGRVSTGIASTDLANCVAIQPDGKILAAGLASPSANDFAIARYNANGSLDTSFDGDGIAVAAIGSGTDVIHAMALQPDGKIVVAGRANGGVSADDFALARYNANGSLDTSFDVDGKLTTSFSNSNDRAFGLAIQPDGKILASGHAYNGHTDDFAFARYNADGSPDTAFNGTGRRFLDFSGYDDSDNNVTGNNLLLQPDGKAVVVGTTRNGLNNDIGIARIDSVSLTPGSLQFSNAAYSVNENGATATITVTRAGGADGAVSVDYLTALGGTATPGSDFTNASGTLTWADGDAANKTFTVPILDDNVFEGNETVNLALGNPLGGAAIGSPATAVLTIVENDACSYSINPTSQNFGFAGGSGSVAVTVINGCAWTAVSNDGWISVTGGASGNGNGMVDYSVAANVGVARTGTITIAGQTFTVTQDVGQIGVSMPTGLTAQRNAPLMVPVNVSDTTGRGVTSFDFTMTYDPAVLTPQATPFDIVGTLSAAYEINVNANTPGVLVVSGFGPNPLTGGGTLLTLKFNATGAALACTNLNFTAFTFNEGTPAAATTNGQACIITGNISGTVNYGNSTVFKPVPNTTLTGAGSTNVSTATDANGDYTLTGFGAGPYTVTPSKTGDVNGITSFDASLISRHVVQLIALTPQQLAAADVSGNGTVTSFDASLIVRYVLAVPASTGSTGTWRFVPVNRSYPNVETDYTAQNYEAVLMGEVSGNWSPPMSLPEELLPSVTKPETLLTAVTVTAPTNIELPGAAITLPVTIGDLTGRGATSFDFDILYNPAVLQPRTPAVANAGTLSSGMNVGSNVIAPGRLRVSGFGANPLLGAGVLVNLQFTVIGAAGTLSPLNWDPFVFNEGDPPSLTVNGSVQVLAPTAVNVSVGGYILTQQGRAPKRAVVTLTDPDGQTQTTTLDRWGHYQFNDLAPGRIYFVTVEAKGYNFTPPTHVVAPSFNVDDLNFTAFPGR